MPYKTISDLPADVRKNFPQDAQQVYQQAYNSAWDRYQLRQRRDNETREEAAHRVALSAVKEKYEDIRV